MQTGGIVNKGIAPQYSPYPFVYLPESNVFHRCGCRLIPNTRKTEGCISYMDAVSRRRPCRACNPTLADGLVKNRPAAGKEPVQRQKNMETAEAASRPVHGKKSIPVRNIPPSVIKPKDKHAASETVLLGGKTITINNKKIVGYCTSNVHPGAMTQALLLEHDCINKNCPYFKKNEHASLWKNKGIGKAEKKIVQQHLEAVEEAMSEIKDELQKIADDGGYTIELVRVERITYWRIRVFYVSENRFGDGKLFHPYLNLIREAYPQLSVDFRHIKDVDGHFVTIEEYRNRRRK